MPDWAGGHVALQVREPPYLHGIVMDLTETLHFRRWPLSKTAFCNHTAARGLIHRRIAVELRWFEALCEESGIGELPALSEAGPAIISERSKFTPGMR
jgi:hypothetical protein